MIGSYMDESFDPKQSGVFVVGGVRAEAFLCSSWSEDGKIR